MDFNSDVLDRYPALSLNVRKAIGCTNPHHQVLVVADYSQIEMRVLSHFSQDSALLKLLQDEGDVYVLLATQIYKTEASMITDQQRSNCKV